MNTLEEFLRAGPGRCDTCGFAPATQGCACDGTLRFALRGKAQGQAAAIAAHPDEATRVEAAIRRLAATGEPFSANDARALHGVTGGVVGGVFTRLRNARVIETCGDDTSSKASTHGHRIFQWRGVAA